MKNQSHRFVSLRRVVASAAAIGVAGVLPTTLRAQAADADANRSGASSSSTMNSTTLDAASRSFIHHAAKTGMMEVRLSQLALERTADAKIRVCAEAMVNDYQRANAELAALANRQGILLPLDTASASLRLRGEAAEPRTSSGAGATTSSASTPELSRMLEEVQAAVNKLSRESGAGFDRAYLDEVVKGHEKAIEQFEEQSNRTSFPELAQFAQATLPTLREHLSRARALQQGLQR